MAAGHGSCSGLTAMCQLAWATLTSVCHQGPIQLQRYWLPSVPLASPALAPAQAPGMDGLPTQPGSAPPRLLLEGAEAEPTRAARGDCQSLRMPSHNFEASQDNAADTELRNDHGSGYRSWPSHFARCASVRKRGLNQDLPHLMDFCEDEMGKSTGALGTVLGRGKCSVNTVLMTEAGGGRGTARLFLEWQPVVSVDRVEGSRLRQGRLGWGQGSWGRQEHPVASPMDPPHPSCPGPPSFSSTRHWQCYGRPPHSSQAWKPFLRLLCVCKGGCPPPLMDTVCLKKPGKI